MNHLSSVWGRPWCHSVAAAGRSGSILPAPAATPFLTRLFLGITNLKLPGLSYSFKFNETLTVTSDDCLPSLENQTEPGLNTQVNGREEWSQVRCRFYTLLLRHIRPAC